MNDPNLTPDDPRLTAYALGELAGAERAAVEAALRRDAKLRAAVEEIRAAAARLADALATEPQPSIFSTPPMEVKAGTRPPLATAAIIPNRDPRKPHQLDGGPLSPAGGELRRVPRAYFAIAGLAAACFATIYFAGRASLAPNKQPSVTAPGTSVAATPAKARTAPTATVPPAVAVPTSAPAIAVTQPTELAVTAPAPAATPSAAEALAPALPKADPLSLLGQLTAATEPRTEAGGSTEKPAFTVAASPSVTEIRTTTTASFTRPAPPSSAAGSSASPLLPPAPGPLIMSPTPGDPVPESVVFTTPAPVTPPPPGAPAAPVDAPPTLAESAREALMRPLAFVPGAGLAAAARPAADNGFVNAAQSPVASIAIESDTSSFAAIRRFLQQKRIPPRETVRIEELVNYFPYHYPPPRGDAPFAASLEVADAPWAPEHRLVRIGLQAREAQVASRPPANLVFVLDVVDVGRLPSRLPMIREAIASLVGRLRPDDRVALVSCRHDATLVLPPTPVARSREILGALNRLASDGGHSRMKGIQLAYDTLAAHGLATNGRVVLCTDGNAGITITAEGALARVIQAKARAGIALTAFGFGMGIYRDSLIEFLAEWGSGSYGYIDTRRDAQRMLAEDINGPAVPIAKDVKVEIEFNPARVASYRLIGYENRVVGRDGPAGGAPAVSEVSAGHAVTALFEIVPADGRAAAAGSPIAGLRYRPSAAPAAPLTAPDPNELLAVKVRYKKPGGAIGQKLDLPLADARRRFVEASADFKFAAAVAGFGMVLRDSPHKGATTLATVIEWAEAAALEEPDSHRSEFLELAREAQSLVR